MALKVKAVERKIKFTKDENDPGVYRYVIQPDLYIVLNQAKVIREAAMRSGVSQGVMKACWDAAGEVIKAWATEGHSVALPGLGSMRFGLRAKSVEKVEDVKTSLISSRRIIFTPTQDLKDELANTAIQITCYDRNGDIVKRVTSADAGTVEDPEGTSPNPSEGGEPDNTGGGESRIICYRSEKRAGIERMSALFSHDREIILKDYHLKILFISFIYFSVRPLTYFCAF